MRIHIATKIALGMAFLIMGVVCLAGMLGLIPDEVTIVNQGRASLCEMFAIQCASAVTRHDVGSMRSLAVAVADRDKDILSLGVRDIHDRLLIQAGPHEKLWPASNPDHTLVRVDVPIFLSGKKWGTVEFCFHPPPGTGFAGMLFSSQAQLVIFVSMLSLLGIMFVLRRVLQHLDPSTVIPDRVKSLLDTLAEGVLVLDTDHRVVVVNNAFATATGLQTDLIVGQRISNVPWRQPGTDDAPATLPWVEAARTGITQRGTPLMLHSKATGSRIFAVSASLINGAGKQSRGVLVSLDDVTKLHDRNSELVKMVKELEKAQEIVHNQNAQLSVMASKDALTGCFNRRALFERLSTAWADAKRYKHPLSVVMVDVDHFKSVNDKHGHAVGDQVLQRVAHALMSAARQNDIVCRYGGEEFCILLPHTDTEPAEAAAERLRNAIELLRIGALCVTASLGVASRVQAHRDPEALIEAADAALYAAKRSGRNRVVRADRMPENVPTQPTRPDRAESIPETAKTSIPYPAVTALMAALQQRDLATAAHCRRVADLSVLVGEDLLDARDCLVLEVAALLHDIGKIGVPDAILLKPGALTPEEFEIMDRHSYIGIEIIQSAFKSNELTYIVRTHHAYYGANPRQTGLPRGEGIPLRARILSIVDAYDAMVSDRVYRKGRSQQDAFQELRRCAGTQFDPVLVERFIEVVSARDEHRQVNVLSATQERWAHLSVEVERLASAVDARDMDSVNAVAHHLGEAAEKMEIPGIAELALRLHDAASVDHDITKLLEITNEMLATCQSAQEQILAPSTTTHAELRGEVVV